MEKDNHPTIHLPPPGCTGSSCRRHPFTRYVSTSSLLLVLLRRFFFFFIILGRISKAKVWVRDGIIDWVKERQPKARTKRIVIQARLVRCSWREAFRWVSVVYIMMRCSVNHQRRGILSWHFPSGMCCLERCVASLTTGPTPSPLYWATRITIVIRISRYISRTTAVLHGGSVLASRPFMGRKKMSGGGRDFTAAVCRWVRRTDQNRESAWEHQHTPLPPLFVSDGIGRLPSLWSDRTNFFTGRST